MCNFTDSEEPLVSLRGKGVLVVAGCLETVRGVVGALEAEGAHVLVASAQACELTQVVAGGMGSASPHLVRGLVRGLTVDLRRHSEIVRVFRWVDGMLPRLDALVSVLDIKDIEDIADIADMEDMEDGGHGPPGGAERGKSSNLFQDGDVALWRGALEEQCLAPLELLLEAASRMRLRRGGHLVQIGVRSGGAPSVDARSSPSGFSGGAGRGEGPGARGLAWGMLSRMLEARRKFLAGAGVRLTLLEVLRGGSGIHGVASSAPHLGNRAEDLVFQAVRSAALYCLHAPGSVSVELLRVNGSYCG